MNKAQANQALADSKTPLSEILLGVIAGTGIVGLGIFLIIIA